MAEKTIDWLIMAEKNSQAEAFAKGLFDLGKPKGSFEKNGMGGRDISSVLPGTVVIVRASGHLYGLEYPEKQDKKYDRNREGEADPFLGTMNLLKSDEERLQEFPVELDIDNLKYKISSKNKYLANNIATAMSKAKNIVIGTDYDAEGEMIAYNVIVQHQLVNRLDWSHVYRAHINSLFEANIRQYFNPKNLVAYGDKDASNETALSSLRAQGFARSIADYEYGMSFSLYGEILRRQMGLQGKSRYGRLKNSILGEIRRVELEHDAFKPYDTYRIDAKIEVIDADGHTQELPLKSKRSFENQADAKRYAELLNSQSQTVTFRSKQELKEVPSPKLWSRTELLVAMNKVNSNLDWGAVLQKDYEIHKLMSYPRTSSQHINQSEFDSLLPFVKSPDSDVMALLKQRVAEMAKVYGRDSDLVFDHLTSQKRYVDSAKVLKEGAHYAIIPTPKNPSASVMSQMGTHEKELYLQNLYVTMSMFVNPAVDQLEHIRIQGPEDLVFGTDLVQAKTLGWKLLVKSSIKNDPLLKTSDGQEVKVSYQVTAVPAKQKALYKQPSLLDMLKKNNWGTEATRDATIMDLIKSKMIVRTKEGLRPNDDLKPVLDKMSDEGWIDLHLTKEWQDDLSRLRTYEDSLLFIDKVRQTTRSINEGVLRWYRSTKGK